MPDRHHDATRSPDDDHAAAVLPFHHAPATTPRRSTQERRWRVERIDTEPMTTQQYDRAVTMLATLIGQWRRTQENVNEAHKEAA